MFFKPCTNPWCSLCNFQEFLEGHNFSTQVFELLKSKTISVCPMCQVSVFHASISYTCPAWRHLLRRLFPRLPICLIKIKAFAGQFYYSNSLSRNQFKYQKKKKNSFWQVNLCNGDQRLTSSRGKKKKKENRGYQCEQRTYTLDSFTL